MPKEVKNSIFGSYCGMMVGAGYFRTVSHEHLPVGHTHEDIGAWDPATLDTFLISLDLLMAVLLFLKSETHTSECCADMSEKEMTNCTSVQLLMFKSCEAVELSWFQNIVSRQHPSDVVEWHTQNLFVVSCILKTCPCESTLFPCFHVLASSGHCTLRLLMTKVAPLFTQKGLEFKVEYINKVRDWRSGMPNISTLYGAYRRRSVRDAKVIPHSFTFIRRESDPDPILLWETSWGLSFLFPFSDSPPAAVT